MKFVLVAAFVVVPLTAPAVSFATGPEQQIAALDPVTVTSTRTPVLESDTLAPALVIDRAEIERSQAADVAGILRQYAGLEITRLGGPGQPASLFVRGGNSNYTVVLIDGVRINDATTGAAPLADISPEMIERIEVIEGPRAALYGADAIGGIVNIITRQPGPAQLNASIGGGSYNTLSGGAALRDQGSVGGHAWGAVLDAQQQHSGGFPIYAGNSQNSGYRNRTLNGRGTLDLDEVELQVRGWDSSGNTQYQKQNFAPPSFSFSGLSPVAENFHDQILALQARSQLTTIWHSSLTFSRSLDQLEQNQSNDFLRTIRPELDWHNIVVVDVHNRVSFGVRANRERVDALSFGTEINETKDSDYGYVQDELNYGHHHGVVAVNYLHDGAFGERFDWNAEYGYDLFAHTRLIATAGTAFHTPTANDRFGFGGNPDLKPAKARNYELAVRQQITAHQQTELRLFRTDVRDLIQYVGVTNQVENVDSARSDGVQLSWRYTDAVWDAHLNAIWQDPRDRSQHKRLLRRARLIGSAQVNRRLGRFEIGAGVYSSTQRADVGGISGAPTTDGGYAVFDLTAGVQMTPQLRLNARLENAFNHHYQTANGFNQSDTAVYATLRYSVPL